MLERRPPHERNRQPKAREKSRIGARACLGRLHAQGKPMKRLKYLRRWLEHEVEPHRHALTRNEILGSYLLVVRCLGRRFMKRGGRRVKYHLMSKSNSMHPGTYGVYGGMDSYPSVFHNLTMHRCCSRSGRVSHRSITSSVSPTWGIIGR